MEFSGGPGATLGSAPTGMDKWSCKTDPLTGSPGSAYNTLDHNTALFFPAALSSHFTMLYTRYVTSITTEKHIGREGKK